MPYIQVPLFEVLEPFAKYLENPSTKFVHNNEQIISQYRYFSTTWSVKQSGLLLFVFIC